MIRRGTDERSSEPGHSLQNATLTAKQMKLQINKIRKVCNFATVAWLWGRSFSSITGPLQLVIHMVFVGLSHCIRCSPAWRFCTLWMTSCKGPIRLKWIELDQWDVSLTCWKERDEMSQLFQPQSVASDLPPEIYLPGQQLASKEWCFSKWFHIKSYLKSLMIELLNLRCKAWQCLSMAGRLKWKKLGI